MNPGPAPCGCHPGTDADGWMERRSPACLEAEREEWRRLWRRWRAQEPERQAAAWALRELGRELEE